MVPSRERMFEAMLDSVLEGKYSVDQNGVCTFINPPAAAMLGYRPEDCLGKSMHALIHHSYADGTPYPLSECPIDKVLRGGKITVIRDEVMWRSDGTSMPVEYTVHPFTVGPNAAGATITIRDLTERRAAELSLREQASVSSLTADIGLALTRATSLEEMLGMCTDVIVSHLNAAFARIWTVDETGTMLELQASSGIYTHLNGPHARVPIGQFKIGLIAAERVPHLTNDVSNDPRVGDHEWARREGMVSFAGYPLIVDGELIGVVALFAKRTLQPETLTSLGTVANSIALGTVRKRKEAAVRDSVARYRSILETSLDCVIVMDTHSRILEWNHAAELMFGYRREQILNMKVSETIIPVSLREKHRTGMAHYLKTGYGPVVGRRIEITGLRASGEEFPIELAVNRINLPGPALFTATIRDITDRKQIQEDLERAKEAAEAANTAKSSFLANMSHELRTPLNAILGYSEMLLEEARENSNETLTKDLTRINSAGKHLLALIGDILDLSKIDAGKMDLYPETFSVDKLIREVASTVDGLVARNGNTLQISVEPDLQDMFADVTKMRQNLFNLLSNAAKFTSQGKIELTVSSDHKLEHEQFFFTVTDTGRGIPMDRMNQLFMPFSQLEKSVSRDFGGTGLGLTITRRFCQMMGGDISVTSELGKGSSFTIQLPRVYKPTVAVVEEAGLQATVTSEPGTNLVLVIDDDSTARDLMNRNLARAGLTAVMASSGEEGIRLARELKPKVITLDVLMPGMDGWAVLQELKGDPELADIPVVMATMVTDRSLGYSLGASDYLMKPVTRERLQSALSKYKCVPPPCSVLLVEDDLDSRDLLRNMLEREGWTVMAARDGVEALARLAEHVPKIILLDLMMPNMDGFELIQHLSKKEEWRSIPVLVVTGKDLTEQERARLNGHVERILTKDALAIDQLLGEVRSLISSCLAPIVPVAD